MKNLFGLILLLVLGALWAQPPQTIYGQMNVIDVRFTWGSDSAHHLLHLGGQVFRDTSTSDTSGSWKRQDNTSDSCSNPVYIGRTVHPVWKFAHFEDVRARDPDSATLVYRYEVRRLRLQHRKDTTWGAWVKVGQGAGYTDVTLQDTVAMPNVKTNTMTARYGLFFVGEGQQLRACPDELPGTANQATDSIFTKNGRLVGR